MSLRNLDALASIAKWKQTCPFALQLAGLKQAKLQNLTFHLKAFRDLPFFSSYFLSLLVNFVVVAAVAVIKHSTETTPEEV